MDVVQQSCCDLLCRLQKLGTALLLFPAILCAQPPLAKSGVFPGEERRVQDELIQAEKLAGEKNWEAAVIRYEQILAESGDILAVVEPNRLMPARWLVHHRMARLDPAIRKLFRTRHERTASQWLNRAIAERDTVLLDRIIAEWFCTDAAEQALHTLGDIAFERGDFESALRYWRMLARPATAIDHPAASQEFELLHPEQKGGSALPLAKQILALHFGGNHDLAQREFVAYRKQHPMAKGTIAGKTGLLADLLQSILLAKPPHVDTTADGEGAENSWPTFGGSGSRNNVIRTMTSPYWPPLPNWRAEIPTDPTAKPHKDLDPPTGTTPAVRSLAFHPVITNGLVLVSDACRLFAFDLITGKLASAFDLRQTNGVHKSVDVRVPSRGRYRYSLSVKGNRVYARFGAQSMQPSADKDSSANDTWIVCFAVEQGEKGSEIKYLWQLRGRLLDSEAPAFFEGAPLVRSGRLYVARTRFDGRRSITSIDCFESDSIDRPNDPPSLRWSTDVWNCEAFSNVDGERHQHQLLTDAGPNIVYCSHSGCVVAVDAQSGKRIWAVRYESSPHPLLDGATPPDLSPAIYSSGRIYAAPTDSNRIYCFDALTGAKRWESNPVRVGHLLTADRNQLVVTTGGHPQGIRVYDTQTGNPIWTRPDEGDLMSFGRGMVTTNWIIWPTRLGLRVLRRIDGEPLDGGIHSDVLGNLAFASGCLVAATPTEIVGFVPERYRLPQIELDAKANPDDSFAKLRLVDALIEDGNLLAADTALKEIEERSHAVETQQGQSLSIAGTHRRHRLLMAECVHRFRQSRIADAITLAKTATAGKYMPENRLLAALFLRQINSSLLDDLLESPELRSVWRTRPDGTPETVADCLWRTVSDTSRKARESLAATNMDERSVMRYAETRTGRERCLKIAQQLEHAGNFDSALAHYHAALRSAWNVTDDSSALDDRHNATSGIIRLYERQNYAEAAVSLRRAYSVTKEKPQVPQTEATSPNLVALTWTEAWRVPLSQYAERPLRRFGHELSSQRPTSQLRLYFSSESSLICRSIEDGREIWHKKLEFLGEQVAEWADSVLVAGPGGLSRVRQKDGHVLWSFLAHDSMPQPDQFESYRLNVNQRRDPLHGFILAGPRVFALHNHKLLALDAETGHVLWQRTAPGAPLSPVRFECNFLATEEAVVARTTSDSVLLLDARNGSIRVRKDSARQSWYAAPVALDTHSAIVASDSDRVTCLNLVSGEASWERKLSGRFSLAGTMPQLRQVGGDLLVIIERNYGYEMERWSSANGKPSGDPVLLGSEFPNLALAEIKDRFAVFAYSSRVDAYDLTTSQRTWSTPLPPSTAWHCRAAGSNLLLTPYATTRPATVPQIEGLRTEHKFALPTIGSYHASFNLLYHVLRNRRWQVLQVNPLTGKVHNAFEVSSNGSHGQLLCGDRHAAVYVDGSLIGLKTK